MVWDTSVVWVDVNGNRTITRINTVGGFASFSGSLRGCSLGDFLQWWESSQSNNPLPTPTSGVRQSVGDRAALLFLCADNTICTLIVPAPSSLIFMSDGETVDPTAPAISTLVANAIGSLTNPSGSLAVSFVAGYLLPRAKSPL